MLLGCLEKLEGNSGHLEVNQGQTDYLLREVEGLRKVQLSDLEDASDTGNKALKYMDNLAGRGGGIRTHDLVVPNYLTETVVPPFFWDLLNDYLVLIQMGHSKGQGRLSCLLSEAGELLSRSHTSLLKAPRL